MVLVSCSNNEKIKHKFLQKEFINSYNYEDMFGHTSP